MSPTQNLQAQWRSLGVVALSVLVVLGGIVHSVNGRNAAFFAPVPSSEGEDGDSGKEESKNESNESRTSGAVVRKTSRKKSETTISLLAHCSNPTTSLRPTCHFGGSFLFSRGQAFGNGLIPIRC